MIQIIFDDGRHAEYTTEAAMDLLIRSFFRHPESLYFLAEHSGVGEGGEFSTTLERWMPDEVMPTIFMASGWEGFLLASFFSRLLYAEPGEHIKLAMMLRAGVWNDGDLDVGLRAQDMEELAAAIAASRETLLSISFFVHQVS